MNGQGSKHCADFSPPSTVTLVHARTHTVRVNSRTHMDKSPWRKHTNGVAKHCSREEVHKRKFSHWDSEHAANRHQKKHKIGFS